MKISGVQAQLIGSDILSIINEFVKVDGLELKEVTIDNAINIKGTFKKGVSIDFAGQLTIEKVENSIVTAKFSKLKLMKLGFFRPIRSLALKIGLGQLKIIGIDATKDRVILDIKKLLKDIPYVDIDLKALYIKGQALHAEVENINISLMGNIIKVEEPEVITEDADEVEEPVNKVADYYTLGRDKLQEKLPDGAKKISDYIFVVPDIVALICRMLKDSRVPIKTKLVVSASLAYVIFPTDLIPDKIPFIGKIDEIAVVFFALSTITNGVLQGIDRMMVPVKHAAISLVIHIPIVYLLIMVGKLDAYGLVIGNISFAFVVCILNWISVAKALHYKQEVMKTFGLPFAASVTMGFVAYFSYEFFHRILHSNAISVVLSIVIAVIVYGISIILLRTMDEEELLEMPAGRSILKLCKKLHMM